MCSISYIYCSILYMCITVILRLCFVHKGNEFQKSHLRVFTKHQTSQTNLHAERNSYLLTYISRKEAQYNIIYWALFENSKYWACWETSSPFIELKHEKHSVNTWRHWMDLRNEILLTEICSLEIIIMKLLSSHQYNSFKIYNTHRNLALIQLYWIFDSEKVGDHYLCY